MTGRHTAALFGSALLVFGVVTVGVVIALRVNPLHQTLITGAVVVDDSDPRKQMPIPNTRITAMIGRRVATATSDASGFFRLTLPFALTLGRDIQLSFNNADYQPLTMAASTSDQLFIARLRPRARSKVTSLVAPQHKIANVRIRYTVQTESFPEVGSAVRTFVVVNTANLACRSVLPCSPDGQWKAASSAVTLDAGEHSRFRNVRATCIAGPCPFTHIESEELRQGDQILHVSALTWGDTATFLVEADVVRSEISDMVRQSFPVVFGEGLSFTLPPGAAGPSLEAELDGQDTFFPLGPDLFLSWATCTSTGNPDHSTLYSCELKPEYRFQ